MQEQADPTKLLVPFEKLVAEPAFNSRGPRRAESNAEDGNLKTSIAERGLITPLEVWPLENGYYRIVSGFRRYGAISELRGEHRFPLGDPRRFDLVPVSVFHGSELESYLRNIAENMGRAKVRPWDLGERIVFLREKFDLSVEDLAKSEGISRSYAFHCVKVATMLAPEIASYIRETRDIPIDVLIRWVRKPHPEQVKEFNKWRKQTTETDGRKPKASKDKPAAPRFRLAPRLLQAVQASNKSRAWKEGATAALRYLLGQTQRPPVPVPQKGSKKSKP